MTPLDFVLLALATNRWTRLVVADKITEPLRTWASRWPDGLGYLVTCPHCASPYFAALTVTVWRWGPEWLWLAVVVVPAVAAVTSLIAIALGHLEE